MGKKVSFATSNIDKDPYYSSKFNGFASSTNSYDEDGEPYQAWDGSTLFGHGPSGSSSKYIPVYGPGTSYPVGFTLNELIELYWRIKYIKITVNTNGYNGYPNNEGLSWDLSLVFTTNMKAYLSEVGAGSFFPVYNAHYISDNIDSVPVNTDEELNNVKNPGFKGGIFLNIMTQNFQFTPMNPEDNGEASYSHNMSDNMATYGVLAGFTYLSMSFLDNRNPVSYDNKKVPQIIKPLDSDLYYPALSFSFHYNDSGGGSGSNPVRAVGIGSGAGEVVGYIPGGNGAPEFTGLPEGEQVYKMAQCGTLNFLGKSIPLYSFGLYFDRPGVYSEFRFLEWYFGINANINAYSEVVQYWEYDDGNGNPIYDKNTGVTLRDPITGVPV